MERRKNPCEAKKAMRDFLSLSALCPQRADYWRPRTLTTLRRRGLTRLRQLRILAPSNFKFSSHAEERITPFHTICRALCAKVKGERRLQTQRCTTLRNDVRTDAYFGARRRRRQAAPRRVQKATSQWAAAAARSTRTRHTQTMGADRLIESDLIVESRARFHQPSNHLTRSSLAVCPVRRRQTASVAFIRRRAISNAKQILIIRRQTSRS